METIRVIDADTHVLETEDTWSFLKPGEQSMLPVSETSKNTDPTRKQSHYWNFMGHRRPRIYSDEDAGTPRAARELLDIKVRIRDMDAAGVDTHIMYPTVFLTEPGRNAGSGNRVGAQLQPLDGQSRRTLGGPAALDLPRPDAQHGSSVEEMRFAKEHGACGVLKKGDQEAGHWPAEEFFYPFYEEAQRLDLAICFHLGSGVPDFPSAKVFEAARFMRTRLPVVHAIHSIVYQKLGERFPTLRWAAVECGAGWMPWVKWDLDRRSERLGVKNFDVSGNIFTKNNIFVTCQPDEDLEYIIRLFGDDNLIAGSDYSHVDPSTEPDHVESFKKLVTDGVISETTLRKILYDNPKKCYGL